MVALAMLVGGLFVVLFFTAIVNFVIDKVSEEHCTYTFLIEYAEPRGGERIESSHRLIKV